MRRSVADGIKLYGSLLGLSDEDCEQMARGGTPQARIECMRDLRRRYREENTVPEAPRRAGPDQVVYWRERVESTRFVYFIQQGGRGPVKIGVAVDPNKRMRNLQTGNPTGLHLRHAVPGDLELERDLHHRFREARIRGEWFGLAYLQLILVYAAGLSAEHIQTYERERSIPIVFGGTQVISAARLGEMRVDLRRLVERYGYRSNWEGNPREVNEIMAREYGLTPEQVEAEVLALGSQPDPWRRRRGDKRAYRLTPDSRPT